MGDKPGHPFRGNQWTTVAGANERYEAALVAPRAAVRENYDSLVDEVLPKFGDYRLPPDEADSVALYMGSSDNINGHLRGYRSHDTTRYMAHAENIDRAFKLVRPTKEDMTLFRGLRWDDFSNLQPGDTIEDKGFVSTSTDAYQARGFGTAVAIIHTPAGTNMLPVSSSEMEFILPRGSKFEYLGRQRDDVTNKIFLRLKND